MELNDKESVVLEKAFQDPEFRKLFHDYVSEIQNPINKEENENYIRQLEKDMKVPDGKYVIHPKQAFVIKVKKVTKELKQHDNEKLFINIVSSDVIQTPKQDKVVEGKNGSYWTLPHSVGPLHMEKDNKKENVPTFDCCFNPQAIHLSSLSLQFKEFLIQTAMAGVQSAYQRMNQEVILNTPRLLKNVIYKNGQPASMIINCADMESKWKDVDTDNIIKPKITPYQSTISQSNVSDDSDILTCTKHVMMKDGSGLFKKGFLSNANKPLYCIPCSK